ncbi:Rieske (2Fe-2S) protein [Actinoallomurus iriomotensis]|uniref:Cytochrome bc1 complex Rieske iron-sulfur subunit n=1 Tax=Actinoallomurus iriomotensis TaxID=478107 RepID=A0A9W6W5I3_9ACTN|nr:Rieske (2Fe-2S) protein [Actinoallomurus iriomotensis]GLY92090.1 iron-sulfur protein [Actinoallomurus iriomotensis]
MPFEPSTPGPESTRRGMLVGVGLVGLAGTLTACGGSKDDSSADASQGTGSQNGGGQSGGGSLGKAADIPVGGGKIFKDEKVVVTQPKQGEFKAFSAICTHRGCPVGSVSDGKINCPCHGSAFNVADGSVAKGPADKPLPSKNVTVQNGELKLG